MPRRKTAKKSRIATQSKKTVKTSAKTRRSRKPVKKSATKQARTTRKKAVTKKSTAAARKQGSPKAISKKPAGRARAYTARRIANKAPGSGASARKRARRPSPRVQRIRRTLEDALVSPPSSLNLVRRGSAVRTGREELAEHRRDYATLTPDITGGDMDADVERTYFSGEEAPGGDHAMPDQDVVEEIGRAIGLHYDDAEQLRPTDKVEERDRHRWELDPASSEDYKGRR